MRPTRQTPLTLALVALAACQGPGLAEPDRFAEPRGDTPDDGEVFLAPAVPHEAAPLEGGETGDTSANNRSRIQCTDFRHTSGTAARHRWA